MRFETLKRTLGVRQKFVLLAISLIASTALAVGYLVYRRSVELLTDEALARVARRAKERGDRLIAHIETMGNDVRFIAEIAPVYGIFRARESENHFDAEGNSSLDEWKSRAAFNVQAMLKYHPLYTQARVLDIAGNEIVRVDQQGENLVRIPDDQLQNKADRDYVKETVNYQAGEVYLSPISLNRERGQIAVPEVQTIRVATPIFEPKSGKRWGLTVINANIGAEFEAIKLLYRSDTVAQDVYMTDEQGRYLAHPDPVKEFGFDRGRDDSAMKDFPALVPFFDPASSQMSTTLLLNEPTGNKGLFLVKLPFSASRKTRFITIGVARSYEDIVHTARKPLIESIGWGLLLILAGMAAAYGFSSRLVQPLERITKAIENFGQNRHTTPLPLERADEIGVLARAYDAMVQEIQTREEELATLNSHLEAQVEERTRELSTFKETLDRTSDGVFIVDDDTFRLLYVNQGACQQTGRTPSELEKMTLFSITDGLSAAQYRELVAPIRQGKEAVVHFETKHIHSNGQRTPVEVFVQYVALNNERQRIVAIARDITERRRLDQMKDELISTVSHELRTPLTSIKGSLALLNAGVVGELPQEAGELVDIACRNTERLLLLINDLLDFQKITSDALELHFGDVAIWPLLQNAVKENEGFAVQHGVNLVIDSNGDDISAYADPDRLMQVVTNLLSNAAKFSPRGADVVVSVKRMDKMARIAVSDHGPGIPDDFRARIFEKFSQRDASATRHVGGTGLGLAIVKAIVQKHNGQVTFDTQIGVGTTFYVDLPIARVSLSGRAP